MERDKAIFDIIEREHLRQQHGIDDHVKRTETDRDQVRLCKRQRLLFSILFCNSQGTL